MRDKQVFHQAPTTLAGEERDMSWFDPSITTWLRTLMPWPLVFILFTGLGEDIFYVALVLVGFWAYKKKESILVVWVLLVSVLSNYWVKLVVANPRPNPSYWWTGIDASNYSTPSGHAQNSAMLFGWLAVKAKRWWMYLLAVVLTVLIGVSRVYLGVHYLGDVVLGWALGLVLLSILLLMEKPLSKTLSRYKTGYLYLALFLFGLAATFISTYLLPQPPEDNFGALGGLTMGVALGLLLERRFVNFTVEPLNGQKWRLVLRVVIGLMLVIGTMFGLAPFLPTTEVWLRALRYALVAIVGAFVWPAIFKAARL